MFLMTGEDDLPRELLDAPRERLLMEIRFLRDEAHHRRVAELDGALRLTQQQLSDTETRLLHSRDFAIGAAALDPLFICSPPLLCCSANRGE